LQLSQLKRYLCKSLGEELEPEELKLMCRGKEVIGEHYVYFIAK
jgi:hypothetical protein